METVQLRHSDIQNSNHQKNVVLIAEYIVSPANYGMMIRTAEAFGVNKIVFISNEYDEVTSKMKKTSRSAEKYVEIEFQKDLLDIIQKYQNECFDIFALERTNDSVSINKHVINNDKIVLIIGSESIGVSQLALDNSKALDIPMYGTNSSMNLVVATGIALNAIVEK